MLKSRKFWFVALVSFVLLVLPNGFYSAFDKDEPKYLEAAWEMVKSGDYITPYYNYEFRFDKPILVYWLIAAGYKLFGVNEFGGRFFVSIFGVFTILILYWWLYRRKGENFAFWSSLILLSSLDFIVMSSVAMPDIVLTFFISASLVFFFEAYHSSSEKYYLAAFAASGFATLTKGPVGLVLPGLAAVIYLAVRRELLRTLKRVPWLSGFGIYLAIALPWYGAILYKHGYQFFKDFIIFHNIHRFTSKVPGHPTQWWYYLANYPWMFLPWSFIFPFALFRAIRKKLHITDDVLSFSVIWFFTVIIFFQIAHTKLAHYLLPSFPPFAVITAWYLNAYRERLPALLTTVALLVLSVSGMVFFCYKGWGVLNSLFLVPAAVASVLVLRREDVLKILLPGFLTTMFLFKWITLPSLEPFRAKPVVGKKLREIADKCRNCKFYFLKYTSPEVVFYFRRGQLKDIHFKQAEELLAGREPVVIVTRENRLKKLRGNYSIILKRKELITNHNLVVISNRSLEQLDGD